jgi:hypothetical protein
MSNGSGPVNVMVVDSGQAPPQSRKRLRESLNSNNPANTTTISEAVKKVKLPDPPPPGVSGVGVMDVGQGSCLLAYGQNGNPLFYFDIGYPLWFYTRSAPAALNPNVGPYRGPCLYANPVIVLSHWDWDHWRLAGIAHAQVVFHGVDIVNLQWIIPAQNVGPVTANFRNALTNVTVWPMGLASQNFPGIGTIVRCTGPAADINNSGLAIIVPILLPSNDPNVHIVVFTADASFGNVPVPLPAWNNITGITAVHHGADSHGAAANLPNPPAPYNITGRIAYSYGVYQRANGTFAHPYGHPRVPAITAYRNNGFRNQSSTAESGFYANDGVRGNIRMGLLIGPQCPPNSCAFRAFPKTLNN